MSGTQKAYVVRYSAHHLSASPPEFECVTIRFTASSADLSALESAWSQEYTRVRSGAGDVVVCKGRPCSLDKTGEIEKIRSISCLGPMPMTKR
jgi:hypothetical protein